MCPSGEYEREERRERRRREHRKRREPPGPWRDEDRGFRDGGDDDRGARRDRPRSRRR